MPGRRTSVAQCSLAATFEAMTEFGKDLPMTVYSLTGFIGGLPSTVSPMMLVRSPLTGIVSFNCWFLTRSPYEIAFAAARDDAVFDRELVFRHAEPLRREIEQSLIGIGRSLADIRRSASEEIEGAAAVGRAIGSLPARPW